MDPKNEIRKKTMFLGSFTEKEKSAFYALAKGLIAADEVLDERETSLMEEYLEEMKISLDLIQ